MLTQGIKNNCIKCGCAYSKYDVNNSNSDLEEYWSQSPGYEKDTIVVKKDGVITIIEGKRKTPKGICQFCNNVSKFFIKSNNQKPVYANY